ncbi:MAG TPA: cytochrome c biogenesis protein CcdA [Alphaproteobacteria bacterium]|nr:cytochrome c biogenesis protein CcdA [Alphaproteobacteria bacterium]
MDSGQRRHDDVITAAKQAPAAPSKQRAAASLALSGVLLVGIGLAGWYGWTVLVLPLAPLVDPTAPLALILFGLLAGTAALFAPCAFPLFPAYVTWYLSLADRAPETGRLWRSLRYGLTCGLGAVVLSLAVGIGLAALGGALSRYLIAAKPFIALILVGAGVTTLTDLSLPLPKWSGVKASLTAPVARQRPLRGLFLYGFGYGLASTGCTLPIYVGLVVFPLSSGAFGRALLAFLSFSAAMGGLMMLLTVCIGLSKRTLIQQLIASTALIRKVSGVVLILIGLYVGYYFLTAGM